VKVQRTLAPALGAARGELVREPLEASGLMGRVATQEFLVVSYDEPSGQMTICEGRRG